ncbi:MAG: toll/interleukin-1 receptor domain-containing protein [Cytophagales bacterium]|nr:MAG: toll/interleukin-1 receptor domain-containing protein [Cytophagales bacterium]
MQSNYEYDLFISFADEDKAFVIELCEALQAKGLKVWCSAKDVPIGADIHAEVSKALPHCQYFLPIISPHYGRFWHEKEFHSAAHNRPNELIIPLAYQVDYAYIQSKEMFSLISSIRILDAREKSIYLIAKDIFGKVKDFSKSVHKKAKWFSLPDFFRNKVVQMSIAAILVLLTYIGIDNYEIEKGRAKDEALFEAKIANISPLEVRESFKEETIYPTTAINFSKKDRFSFKVVKIRAEKKNACTQKKCNCEGLLTLHFDLLNKGEKAVHIIALKVEAKRNEELIFQDKTAQLLVSKERDDCPAAFGIWLLEIPKDNGNVHYLYELSGLPVRCAARETIDIPIALYQIQPNVNKGLPYLPEQIEFTFTFITDEKANAKSKRCYFEKGELICED